MVHSMEPRTRIELASPAWEAGVIATIRTRQQMVPKMGLEPTNLLITSELLYRLELLRPLEA